MNLGQGEKMQQKRLFNILSFCSNIFLVIATTWAVAFYFYHEDGSGNMLAHGPTCFRFFTIDSNIITAVSSLIYLYFNIQAFRGKLIEIPLWVRLFRFISIVAAMVTFFVVLLILVPMGAITKGLSPFYFYDRNCIILHLFAPLVAAITLCVFEKDDKIENKVLTYFSLSSVVVYGLVYFICVVIAKVWPDFYGLTFDGKLYLSPFGALAILCVCWGVIELLYYLQGLCIRKLPERIYGKGQ